MQIDKEHGPECRDCRWLYREARIGKYVSPTPLCAGPDGVLTDTMDCNAERCPSFEDVSDLIGWRAGDTRRSWVRRTISEVPDRVVRSNKARRELSERLHGSMRDWDAYSRFCRQRRGRLLWQDSNLALLAPPDFFTAGWPTADLPTSGFVCLWRREGDVVLRTVILRLPGGEFAWDHPVTQEVSGLAPVPWGVGSVVEYDDTHLAMYWADEDGEPHLALTSDLGLSWIMAKSLLEVILGDCQ